MSKWHAFQSLIFCMALWTISCASWTIAVDRSAADSALVWTFWTNRSKMSSMCSSAWETYFLTLSNLESPGWTMKRTVQWGFKYYLTFNNVFSDGKYLENIARFRKWWLWVFYVPYSTLSRSTKKIIQMWVTFKCLIRDQWIVFLVRYWRYVG